MLEKGLQVTLKVSKAYSYIKEEEKKKGKKESVVRSHGSFQKLAPTSILILPNVDACLDVTLGTTNTISFH